MFSRARLLLAFVMVGSIAMLAACSDDGGEDADDDQQDACELSCSDADGSGDPVDPNDFSFEDASGPFGIGYRTFSLTGTEASGGEPIVTEVWYPTDEVGSDDASLADFVTDTDDVADFETKLEAADSTCTRTTVRGIRGADAVVPDAYASPILVFSHCLGCTRFSSATIAESLASYGFIVIAPDHGGNSYFDEDPQLNLDALNRRVAEVEALLAYIDDAEPSSADSIEALIANGDKANLGMFGHSFGSITTGNIASDHPEILAIVGIAAPFNSLGDVKLDEIEQPVLFEVLEEDNSISEIGNFLIRGNYEDAAGSAWIFEIPDAGHFSVSSLCGIDESFTACCGDAVRQTEPGEAFTYPAAQPIRDLVASDTSAFFSAQLLDSTSAYAFIESRISEREENMSR